MNEAALNEVNLGVWPIFKVFMPWTWGATPTPPPTGTPKTTATPATVVYPFGPDKPINVYPSHLPQVVGPYGVALPTWAETSKPPPGKSFFEQVGEFFNWGTEMFIKYQQSKTSSDYARSVAKMEAEAIKAQQAIAEAQARIAAYGAGQQQYAADWGNYLSAESLKKYSPYLIPIAIGFVTIMLIASRKEKPGKAGG